MVTLFTIGQVARHTGLTPKAIRLYEQRGLIRTAPRSPGGYRLYTENDVRTMAFIGRARSIGLPLGDIERIIAIQDGSGSPCGPVRDMLTRRYGRIEEKWSAAFNPPDGPGLR